MEEEKTIQLIEAYLNGHFKYHIDEVVDRKRPFGNSGTSQIFKDICDITKTQKNFQVSDEEELYNKRWDFVKDCFDSMESWAKLNREDYEIKLVKKKK